MIHLNATTITAVVFTFILCLAGFVRFYKLDKESLRYDELHSIIPTHPDESLNAIIEYSKKDQPPLFFVMLHGWFQLFPYHELSGKAFCALIGVLGVAAMFFLGREIGGDTVGLAGMLMTALNGFHVYYSQELRFYGLLFLMATLSFWAFVRFLRSATAANKFAYVFLTVALLYTHYFALVAVTTQMLIFVSVGLKEKSVVRFWLDGLITGGAMLILFIPWLPVIFSDMQVSSFWIPEPEVSFFGETFVRYFQGWWPVSFKWVLTTVLLLLMTFFLYEVFSSNRNRNEKMGSILLVAWIILTLMIPYLYSMLRVSLMLDRYTIITLPAVILAIALGWSWVRGLVLKVLIALIFVVCVTRVMHKYYKNTLKPQYREIVRDVIHHNKAGLPVFSQHAWHLNYYAKKYNANEVMPLTELTTSNLDSLTNFYVIFPEFLPKGFEGRLSKTFTPRTRFNLLYVDAVYYEKRIHRLSL